MRSIYFILLLLSIINELYAEENDYYKLLGVDRDATVKEIRKAFKTLAVKLHPDKNKDDANADKTFIKLVRAYEVLKDPDMRKQYDLHGDETDTNKFRKQYHSYTYYRDQFGIYDDDPIIVTLSKHDYELNILDTDQAWFVNFYSPNCHHCHELAPTWRKLARELEGVIRIGAVNCEDDFFLCHQLRIEAYPTLLYYEKEFHLYEGLKYTGDRSVEALQDFVLSKLSVKIEEITIDQWENIEFRKQQRLLFLCPEGNTNCPETRTMLKLAASLEGLLPVGKVKDEDLCEKLSENYKSKPIILSQANENTSPDSTGSVVVQDIEGSDTKEILENTLGKLPNPITLDEHKFREIRSNLRSESVKPWLLCFYLGAATDLNLQLKRLPPLIPNINLGLIHCGKSSSLCSSLHVARYPTWGVLKVGGAFELHHGRDILYEVANFAKDSVKSTNLHALSPADFINIKNEGSPWFIDWYAPWCPPCRNLLPELRKASQNFDSEKVQFGTVDCTLHRNLCVEQSITSYPTTVLYNNSQTHRFHGLLDANTITEFVEDMINPSVISLDEGSFIRLMRKPKNELWIVDFFAPWCGPCQKLAEQWRTLAKQVSQLSEVKVAQVDCVASMELCDSQNIRSYPTIRLYPLGSKGMNSVAIYNGNRDAVSLKRWVLSFIPSPVEEFTAKDFKANILTKKFIIPWIVDFYAPWCGPCTHFEPEYRIVAQRLQGQVRSAKIDCEAERVFCGHLGITGYPAVRLYFSPTDFYKIDSRESAQIIKRVKTLVHENDQKYKHDESYV
nr:dnaJ homolog subfamily C member 10-like [Leptinotarsa decemlineata]